jgi:hypothetical protein
MQMLLMADRRGYISAMRRPKMPPIVHRASNHEEARAWDIGQHVAMTPEQRQAVARTLKQRAFPADAKDVRACHRPE